MTDTAQTTDNAAQIACWNDTAARTWTAFQTRIDAMFTPLTALAVDAAAPAPGEHVLDVGCGCGATVLQLAARVTPGGQVFGLDVSEPMAARARERITEAGLDNAQVRVSDAATHPLPPNTYDLLFSRFGVMFFADPAAAFANLHKAMRPGGRLLCAVWRAPMDNSWFTAPLTAASELLPPQPPAEPAAPGPFAFADPDRVAGILAAAGWQGIKLDRHDVPMRLAGPGQLDQATEFATRVGGLARVLTDADADLRAKVGLAVARMLKAMEAPDGFIFKGSIWLISARA